MHRKEASDAHTDELVCFSSGALYLDWLRRFCLMTSPAHPGTWCFMSKEVTLSLSSRRSRNDVELNVSCSHVLTSFVLLLLFISNFANEVLLSSLKALSLIPGASTSASDRKPQQKSKNLVKANLEGTVNRVFFPRCSGEAFPKGWKDSGNKSTIFHRCSVFGNGLIEDAD